jgi:ubiquinone/menaquinone biosynthesis C-methylase UbiE
MERDPLKNIAPIYDYLMGPLTMAFNPFHRRLAPPQPGMKVLDVGCGTGSDLKQYHQGGCQIHGIDLSPGMVHVARKKYGELADFRVCDGADLPYQDETFDLVMAVITFHEMFQQKREGVLKEMIRVLKSDGKILLTDFSPGPYTFPVGWFNRALILFLEFLAGKEHLNNGLEFLKLGGLPGLVDLFPLVIDQTIIINGGHIAFFLLSHEKID